MRPLPSWLPRFLSWIVLVSLGSGQTAWSQAPDSTAVRISVGNGLSTVRLIGRLQEVTADSLILVQPGDRGLVAISRARVKAFERWSGTKSAVGRDAKRGLGIGAGVGLLGGLVAVTATGSDQCSSFLELEPQCAPAAWVFGGAIAGGLVGVLVGAVVGTSNRVDRWTTVPVPARPSLVVLPGRIGLGVPVRLPFNW